MKLCGRCKVEKPLADFHKNRSTSDGLAAYCKPCRKTYGAAKWQERRVEISARRRARHAAADPAERRIKQRMWSYGLSRKQAEHVEHQTHCEWCGRAFDLTAQRGPDCRCVHHDHATGAYVAALCGRCNSIEGWILKVAALAGLTPEAYLHILLKHMKGTP